MSLEEEVVDRAPVWPWVLDAAQREVVLNARDYVSLRFGVERGLVPEVVLDFGGTDIVARHGGVEVRISADVPVGTILRDGVPGTLPWTCPRISPDGNHAYTGLPGNACEECMNTGLVPVSGTRIPFDPPPGPG